LPAQFETVESRSVVAHIAFGSQSYRRVTIAGVENTDRVGASRKDDELISLKKRRARSDSNGKPGKPYVAAVFRINLERFKDMFRTVSNCRLERFQITD
jgi:hypothetical protein